MKEAENMYETSAEDVRRTLPEIKESYSKFDRGRLFLVAGSFGMAGAAVLAAKAALRSGVGYLDIAVPESIYPIVTSAVPEAVCTVYREDDLYDLREKIRSGVKKAAAAAAGPGLGKNRELVMPVLLGLSGEKLLLDADALNFLSERAENLPEYEKGLLTGNRWTEIAMTPHSGEMARLLKTNRQEVEKGRLKAVKTAAAVFHASVLLKGKNTLISSPEGEVWMNTTGSAALARAGAGDTLTGIAGSLMAQGADAFQALRAAAWIHGKAADLGREELGTRAFLPEDLIGFLPKVFRLIEES